jgi:sulfate permease, SulP family
MASAVLVGVNPVYGLYASIAGPIGGGLAVSTRLMVVTTTTAAVLAAGSALGGFSGADRPEALFVLSALAGVMMIAAGLLRWGRFTRFVSLSVLTGFLTGVAVNIILGQLGRRFWTGSRPAESSRRWRSSLRLATGRRHF